MKRSTKKPVLKETESTTPVNSIGVGAAGGDIGSNIAGYTPFLFQRIGKRRMLELFQKSINRKRK